MMLSAMGDVMREAYKRGWITTRDGNVSVRMGKFLYITPSGVRKNIIHPEHICKIAIEDGELGQNQSEAYASVERDMHWLSQKATGKKAVVHLHPPHTIAAMLAGFDLKKMAAQFIELGRYTKVGRTVPALDSGSSDLAEMTAEAIKGADIVGQENHGVTAVGPDPWAAFEHIERLEHICQIILASGIRPDPEWRSDDFS